MRRRLKSSATVMCLIVKVSHLFLAEPGVCVAQRAGSCRPPPPRWWSRRLTSRFFFFLSFFGFFFPLVCKTKPCFPPWLLLCVQRRVFTPCFHTVSLDAAFTPASSRSCFDRERQSASFIVNGFGSESLRERQKAATQVSEVLGRKTSKPN